MSNIRDSINASRFTLHMIHLMEPTLCTFLVNPSNVAHCVLDEASVSNKIFATDQQDESAYPKLCVRDDQMCDVYNDSNPLQALMSSTLPSQVWEWGTIALMITALALLSRIIAVIVALCGGRRAHSRFEALCQKKSGLVYSSPNHKTLRR